MIVKEMYALKEQYARMNEECSRGGDQLKSAKLLSFVEVRAHKDLSAVRLRLALKM